MGRVHASGTGSLVLCCLPQREAEADGAQRGRSELGARTLPRGPGPSTWLCKHRSTFGDWPSRTWGSDRKPFVAFAPFPGVNTPTQPASSSQHGRIPRAASSEQGTTSFGVAETLLRLAGAKKRDIHGLRS